MNIHSFVTVDDVTEMATRFTMLRDPEFGSVKVRVESGILRNGKFRKVYGQHTAFFKMDRLREIFSKAVR
jgi:hypothetical protein